MTSTPALCLFLLASTCTAATYQFCFLEDGVNAGRIEKARAEQLQAGHMQNMDVMWKAGALESAGPVGSLPGTRGIFIFSSTVEVANRLAEKDPKIAAGDLAMKCQTWNGPDGVGKAYREISSRPGFTAKMTRRVGVLLNKPLNGSGMLKTIVAGPLSGGEHKFFALIDTDDIAKVRAELPDAKAFVWFHDIQVWNGVS